MLIIAFYNVAIFFARTMYHHVHFHISFLCVDLLFSQPTITEVESRPRRKKKRRPARTHMETFEGIISLNTAVVIYYRVILAFCIPINVLYKSYTKANE